MDLAIKTKFEDGGQRSKTFSTNSTKHFQIRNLFQPTPHNPLNVASSSNNATMSPNQTQQLIQQPAANRHPHSFPNSND
ncbi:MAG: hypothetical protein MHMPM18_004198 [Marteilia pararefringens]